jgi:hypothetical protein
MKYPCKIYKKIKDEVDIYNTHVNDFCHPFEFNVGLFLDGKMIFICKNICR